MKNIIRLTLLATSIALIGPAFSAGLADAQIAYKSGNWKVLRSIDTMNDTVNCTGIYKENYGIQLTKDTLYVSVRGGLRSVTLRFGEKPARPLRLAEDMEKRVDSIIISGTDFAELLEGDRLRIQASTLVSGIATEDLDISGINSALENISNGCPIQPNVATTKKTEKGSTPSCTEILVTRMKAQGLKENQINAICK